MEGDELRAMLGVHEPAPHSPESAEKTPLPPGIH
jgi:hypothetical protein